MKKIICLLLILTIITSCKSYESSNNSFDSNKAIQIIYTNVLYSQSQDDFYVSVKEYKNKCLKDTPNVALINNGNISKGDVDSYNLCIDYMNDAEYDYATFGIYDFENGLDFLYGITSQAKFKFLLCDASYNGQNRDFFKRTYPFEVVDYDGIKVGYIGVANPRIGETKPDYVKEDGKQVVNFYNETPEVFYDTVQCSIDKAKKMGAQYIVLITNIDTMDINSNNDKTYYYVEELIANISNTDVVINGNEYSQTSQQQLKDKDNHDVLLIVDGLSDFNIGKIIIDNNQISNELSVSY